MKDIAATWNLCCDQAAFIADTMFARSPAPYVALAEVQVRAYRDRGQPNSAGELELRLNQLLRLLEILTIISTCYSVSKVFTQHADRCLSIAGAFSDVVTADGDEAIDVASVHLALSSL